VLPSLDKPPIDFIFVFHYKIPNPRQPKGKLYVRHKKDDIRQTSYSSGGQPNINLAALNPYPLALPPPPEQQEIVHRVESLFALADQIEARLSAARRQVDALTPSLLARAFRGELVPQDPNDEPASALLARVQSVAEPFKISKSELMRGRQTRSACTVKFPPSLRRSATA
jgi:hypothetical protein